MYKINTVLDNLRISLPQWSYVHSIFQLMEQTTQFISTIRKDNLNNNDSLTKDRGKNKNKSNYNINNLNKQTNDNLSSDFNSNEAWNAYISKVIGTHSFLKDKHLENINKFARSFNNGYYLCRLNNHAHNDCTYLNAWKRLGLKAFELEQSNTVITPRSNIQDTTAKRATTDNNLPIAQVDDNDSVDIDVTNN